MPTCAFILVLCSRQHSLDLAWERTAPESLGTHSLPTTTTTTTIDTRTQRKKNAPGQSTMQRGARDSAQQQPMPTSGGGDLRAGCLVELQGFTSHGQKKYNRMRGIVTGSKRPYGWPVRLEYASKSIEVQRSNCVVLGECSQCGSVRAASTLQVCTGCVAVPVGSGTHAKPPRYCSWDCQNEHYDRGHAYECTGSTAACGVCGMGSVGGDLAESQLAHPPLVHGGCGCIAAAGCGLAHISCRSKVAAYRQAGYHALWTTCQTCRQNYTGEMQLGLARDLCGRLKADGATTKESTDRLNALAMLGAALDSVRQHATAEKVHWEVLRVRKRVLGDDSRLTLRALQSVGVCLQHQGKHHEAEPLLRKNLAARERFSDSDAEGSTARVNTLWSAMHLVSALKHVGKLSEAHRLCRETLDGARSTLGDTHPVTTHARKSLEDIHVRVSKAQQAKGLRETDAERTAQAT